MCEITCNRNITPYVHEQHHTTTYYPFTDLWAVRHRMHRTLQYPRGASGPRAPTLLSGSQPEIVLTPQQTMATGQPVWGHGSSSVDLAISSGLLTAFWVCLQVSPPAGGWLKMWNLSSGGNMGNNLLKSHVTNEKSSALPEVTDQAQNRAGVAALCTWTMRKSRCSLPQALDVIPNYTRESFGRTQTA